VPQAQETYGPRAEEDHAAQEQGKLETPEEGGHRQVERVLAHGRGGEVDLTARDVRPERPPERGTGRFFIQWQDFPCTRPEGCTRPWVI